jgi:Spy/CpxP family protein refolding chaperone
LAGVILVAGSLIWAQNDPQAAAKIQGENSPGRELVELTQLLSLTAEQQGQIRGMLAEQRRKLESLRMASSNAGNDVSGQGADTSKRKIQAIRAETDIKIDAILNDGQRVKFAEWQQMRKDRMNRQQSAGSNNVPGQQTPNN